MLMTVEGAGSSFFETAPPPPSEFYMGIYGPYNQNLQGTGFRGLIGKRHAQLVPSERHLKSEARTSGVAPLNWVAVQEIKLSYHNPKNI